MSKTSILCVEPDQLYREVFFRMFEGQPYTLRFAGMEELDSDPASFTEDVLFVSIELPGDAAFDYFERIRTQRPGVPIIFFSQDNLNQYLDKILETGMTNILAKPFTREELLFFLDKLVHTDKAFGLKNYLKDDSQVQEHTLCDSSAIRPCVEYILQSAVQWGFEFEYDFKIDLVIHELLINAMYHGYGYEQEKVQGRPLALKEGQSVVVEVGHDDNRFGISITDFGGNLSRKRVVSGLLSLEEQQQAAEAALDQGAMPGEVYRQHGRGIDIVRKNTGEYYFIIERGKRTQAVIIFDKIFEKDDEFTSLKIIEI